MTERVARVVLQAVVTQYRTAMKEASRDTRLLGQQVEKTGKLSKQHMQTMGRGMMLGGAAVVAGFGVAVAASAKFEKQMSGVKAVSNATSGEMKRLSDAALKAGADTAFSASDAAKAEAELAKAGVSVKDILGGALTGALSLAAAGQLDLADAATVSAQAMNIFKLQGRDVGHIADVFAAGANKSAADVKDFGDALRQGGLVAAQTGLTLEDTTGALAAFADSALVGSDAGTSLKTMLQRLTPQSQEAADLMKQLGITAYDASGKFVGLEAFAGKLQTGLKGLTDEQKNSALATIFGSDAVRAASILYDQGAAGIRDYVDAVNDQGAAARMAKTQMDNLSGDVEALKGSLDTALIKNGAAGNKVLREMTQTATGAVNAFGALPGPVQNGAVAMVGLAGATALAGGAAMVAVPKYAALDAALLEVTGGAVGARAALSRLAYGVGAVAAVGVSLDVLGHGVDMLSTKLLGGPPKANALAESIADLSISGKKSGLFLKTFSGDLGDLQEQMKLAGSGNFFTHLGNKFNVFSGFTDDSKRAKKNIQALDESLSQLVQGGHADAAAQALKAMGVSTSAASKSLPKYTEALAGVHVQTKLATPATGGLSQKFEEQAQAAKDAAQAIRDQGKALNGLFDPIFNVIDATEKQKQAQADLNKALKQHGERSKEYRQAEDAALNATVDLNAAVLEMKASLTDGSSSLDQVNARLDSFVRAGLISAAQARDYKRELSGAVDKAQALSQTLAGMPKDLLVKVRVAITDVTTRSNAIADALGIPHKVARGGLIRGRGTTTSDSIPAMLSNGEYVVNAGATSKHRALLEAINGGRMVPAGSVSSSMSTSSTTIGNSGGVHVSELKVYPRTASTGDIATSTVRALREVAFLSGAA